ncbi:NUDIX domain-containing protein [Nocardioides sp. SOB77]|uniref:NUDIX domain-containing protein n=1 Tax=Nocardioides oceani TaxID=3058369 RepID=A0ABT8FAK5_9ACTN|nr:NUDIX domain-containing protein [Nocardioides oceani]MDN4171641.1 NUDIX domain-containing protein [Nocardioides oceani]
MPDRRDRRRMQRLGAYAVVVRDGAVLLTRLSSRVSRAEVWTLPGGGVDHGEDPRDAVVREVREETGLDVTVGATARVHTGRRPDARWNGRRVDVHSVRLVYDGHVPVDAPAPRVVEVGGTTADARWWPVADVAAGRVPVTPLVSEVLATHRPFRMQRTAAYALVVRGGPDDGAVLLTRVSSSGFHTGLWTLPGGGVEHGEAPAAAAAREVREETGLEVEVGRVLHVGDESIRGVAPNGRDEEFHAIQLVLVATVAPGSVDAEPVAEVGGTSDAVAWIPLAAVADGSVPVHPLVAAALAAAPDRP